MYSTLCTVRSRLISSLGMYCRDSMHHCCSTYLVVPDVVWLRREWRVVGSLLGALPLHPRQNSQLGLPLILQPEETTLLREKGIYIPSIFKNYSSNHKTDWKPLSGLLFFSMFTGVTSLVNQPGGWTHKTTSKPV